MGKHLHLDQEKVKRIMTIKLLYLRGEMPMEEAQARMREAVDKVTAQEFAICEQHLQQFGITDDELADRMEEILEIFGDLLESAPPDVPPGHPIHTYLEEVAALRQVLGEMEGLLAGKFLPDAWKEAYDRLERIGTHFARKQNQLFPALEGKGFDKPSKVMWTLENRIRNLLKESRGHLEAGREREFLDLQEEVITLVEDMMGKEEEILYPTALELVTDEEFVRMRQGDDEIGYCLVETPPPYVGAAWGEVEEKTAHPEGVLPVNQGRLTLEQVNLIFRHLQVDLSYVDEEEIVRFYSDTKHRVFPRSPGVIGREVRNCHPRESVATVEEIIRAFREGEQDEAEFWLEMGGKFIYITYVAVRDGEGKFRGVLETMQDATRIRSLTGSQRLLSWGSKGEQSEEADKATEQGREGNPYGLTPDTVLGDLLKEYPHLKEFLFNLSPKYSKLKNPLLFKTMASVATLEMVSARGGFTPEELIGKLVEEIGRKKGS
ncbi:DUF1858 domain-containing protein [Clostridiales bacterium F-3ap]|uniref:DUF1858 domain-containing protein n=2 Tax=Anaerotalea alkaliphila TaxID=2662126 RepID=A0A7X5HWB1_9FIRM|nr:DUF1858 domain-containing protein [Anaerotalea alkaliphila]